MTKLIFGCGYLGARVAKQWQKRGDRVVAVTRTAQRAAALKQQGFVPLVADVTRPETLADLPTAETVLYAVGWDSRSGATRRQLYVEGLRYVLAALKVPPERILHISSSGIYGDAGGNWVDEDSPCSPRREAGKAFLAAEQLLREHPLGARAITLRMAGMYGPERLLRKAEILSGEPMPAAAGSWLNLIHIDDAAHAVLAAEKWAQPPRLYNITDGSPVDRREYFAFVAEVLGAPPPQFVDPPASALGGRHDGSNKRIRNDRMMAELHIRLIYPNYRCGLRASLPSPEQP